MKPAIVVSHDRSAVDELQGPEWNQDVYVIVRSNSVPR